MVYGHVHTRFYTLFWGILFAICSRFCSQDEMKLQKESVRKNCIQQELITALQGIVIESKHEL